ncbi:MAG: HAD family hydrolase [Clostridia bacterium]|nr:HAD family hydrolase [Clostridia bacterium]
MSKFKYIMWDWNGTILDDLQANFDTINKLLSDRKLPSMESLEQYRDLFGFPVINFYEKIGFDLENEKFQDIARDYVREYYGRFFECDIFPETENVLRYVLSSEREQLIVSATEQESLLKQVEEFGIDHLFNDILGMSDIYARSKVELAQRWMKENGVNPKDVLFIGDTTHDFEVADSIGCTCILISSGHNSKERLLFTGCDVFESLKDVRKYLEEN